MTKEFQYAGLIDVSYQDDNSQMAFCLLLNEGKESWKNSYLGLAESELLQFQKQKTVEAKNSFCFGKISAKIAVSKLTNVPVDQITINHGIFGFPVFHPNPGGFQVSIAHTTNSGFSVCFDEKYPTGIDIEELSPDNNAIIISSLSDIELNPSLIPEGISETLYYHILWSSRESLSKALRTGFLIPLKLLEIKSVSHLSGYFKIEFMNFNLFSGIVFTKGNYVISLVFPTRLSMNTNFIPVILQQFDILSV